MPALDYSQIANWYDTYVAVDHDVPFFRQEASVCRSVLELTSGTGRLSIPLLESGVPLTCLDSCPEMLALLRQKLAARNLTAPVFEMDMCRLSLPQQYDLILIPFNSFGEIAEIENQKTALAGIRRHLAPGGRFLCTLHNPSVRLRTVDGQLRQRGEFAVPDGDGTLRLSLTERHDPTTHIVSGQQHFECLTSAGHRRSQLSVPIRFYLHEKDSFEHLARKEGFAINALWGDYDRSDFRPKHSPFMIWALKAEPSSSEKEI